MYYITCIKDQTFSSFFFFFNKKKNYESYNSDFADQLRIVIRNCLELFQCKIMV
jgi:hypothetical protein